MDRTHPLLPVEFDATEQRTHDYVRHGATNLFAALNLSTGEVIGDCGPRRNGPAFLDFLKKASLRTPAERSMWCWTTCPPTASFRCSRAGNMPGVASTAGLFRGEELAEVLEDLGFVRVGGTHAYVSVRSDDEQGVAVDAVVLVGVALVVGEVGHVRFGSG